MHSVPRSEDSDAFLLVGRWVDRGGKHVYPPGPRSALAWSLSCCQSHVMSTAPRRPLCVALNCLGYTGVEREIAFTGAAVQFQRPTDRDRQNISSSVQPSSISHLAPFHCFATLALPLYFSPHPPLFFPHLFSRPPFSSPLPLSI